MKLNSLYPVLAVSNPPGARRFFVDLLGMRVTFENEWYVSLAADDDSRVQLGLVQYEHESVPEGHRVLPRGVLVTVETAAVGSVYERAESVGAEVLLPLRDEPWGQRHFIARGPDDVLVDVVELIPPAAEYRDAYADA